MTLTPSARQLRKLSLDAVAVEVVRRLRDFGIEPILLKGRSIAERLYPDDPAERTYRDIDLLVAPEHQEIAAYAMSGLGFVDFLAGARPGERCAHAVGWKRNGPFGCTVVELHSTIYGPRSPAQVVWSVMLAHTTTMSVGSHQITVLDDAAMAMQIVLHAAQHGQSEPGPIRDLERAMAAFDPTVFDQAADLARQIEATEFFAAGLLLHPQAQELFARYAGSVEIPRDVALLAFGGSRGVGSLALLAAAPPLRRPRLLLQRLFPSAAIIRYSMPMARRGRLGLTMAYVVRALWMLIRLPAALLDWCTVPDRLAAGRSADQRPVPVVASAESDGPVAHLDQPVTGA